MARAASASPVPGKVSPWDLLGWAFLWGMGLSLGGVALVVTAVGARYYLTPVALRAADPLDRYYTSGGVVGLLLGIVGTGLMSVLLLYSVHKWIPFLHPFGTSRFWMRFHQLCGLLGPLFIVLHAAVRMPNGLVAIGFWCMALVALSGFFGRYLFGYFPATAAGLRVDVEAEHEKLTELRAQLVAETRDAHSERIGEAVKLARDLTFVPTTAGELLVLDAEVRRRADLIRILLFRAGLPGPVRARAERTLLAQLSARRDLAGLDIARRWLRYWNLFHQPVAAAMYLVIAYHVVFELLFGGVFPTLLGAL